MHAQVNILKILSGGVLCLFVPLEPMLLFSTNGEMKEGVMGEAGGEKAAINTCLQFYKNKRKKIFNLGLNDWLAGWHRNTALFLRSIRYQAHLNAGQVLTFLTHG